MSRLSIFEAIRKYAVEELGISEEVPYWLIGHVLWVQYMKRGVAPAVAKERRTGKYEEGVE